MYGSLNSLKAELRLLRLLHTKDGEIECKLQTFSLHDDLPSWKALSYRWGDDEPSHTIHLNGHPLLIRDSLDGFLKQMLAEKRQNWFFIDALCINQDDVTEQAQQVVLMWEIYRRAEEVYAWIVPEPFRNTEWNPFLPQQADEEDEVDPMEVGGPEMAVMQNSFWTRTWIVQEVLLARRLSIRVGEKEVEWMNLLPEKNVFTRRGVPSKNEGLEKMHAGMSQSVHSTLAVQLLSWRHFETRSLRSGHHIPFHKAVDFFAPQSCSRVHDKIYGILGLTNSRIRVDYSAPVIEVFMATLADYLLSLGFMTEPASSTFSRKREWLMKAGSIGLEQNMIAPFVALGMDPFHPVVCLVTKTIADFFAPGKGERIWEMAALSSWTAQHGGPEMLKNVIGEDPKMEVLYIGKACVRFVRFVGEFSWGYKRRLEAMRGEMKGLEEGDGEMMAPGDDGVGRVYGELVGRARSVAEEMWGRFLETGVEGDGEMDEEGWSLVG